MPRGRGLVPILVAGFFALTALAWVLANPPGAGVDEVAHYTKALGVGQGQFAGSPPRVHAEDLANLRNLGEGAAGRLGALARAEESPGVAWQSRTRREFAVPARLGVQLGCWYGVGAGSDDCLARLQVGRVPRHLQSYVGTYQPFAYLAPGLAARAAGDPAGGIRWGRLAGVALCVALIALAAALTWAGSGAALALVGLVTALTPAVVFAAATINPSGLEIAAGLCFGAALLAAARAGRPALHRVWLAVGAAGVVLASCRSFGPLLVAFTVLVVAAIAGVPRVRSTLRESRWPAAAAGVVVALAAVANWAWEFTWQPQPGLARADIGPGLRDGADELPALAQQIVGVFGVLDVAMPLPFYLAWGVLLAAVVGLALRLGTPRERVALVALALALIGLVFALAVAVRPTGFGVQGRYLLPVFVLLPLAAGEIAPRHHRRLSPERTRAYVLTGFGLALPVHVAAWYVNASHWAGGGGPGFLVDGERFEPPIGWWPWALVLLAAAALGVAAALAACPREEHRYGL